MPAQVNACCKVLGSGGTGGESIAMPLLLQDAVAAAPIIKKKGYLRNHFSALRPQTGGRKGRRASAPRPWRVTRRSWRDKSTAPQRVQRKRRWERT